MKSHDIPSIRAKNKKNRVLACGHPPTPSCGATGLPQGPTRRWQRREKRSQNEAKVRGRTGQWEAGLLRKRPVFTGDFGVWRGLRHRPAGGEKIQNEATANAMDGRRQGRCGTPMGAVTEMCEKANDTNEIKPNKTMKDLATDDTEIVLRLWAAVAGESGVAAPALPPQSITRRVGRAVGIERLTINDQRYTNKNQSKGLAYGHHKHKTTKPICRGGARRSGGGENTS